MRRNPAKTPAATSQVVHQPQKWTAGDGGLIAPRGRRLSQAFSSRQAFPSRIASVPLGASPRQPCSPLLIVLARPGLIGPSLAQWARGRAPRAPAKLQRAGAGGGVMLWV